MTSRRPYCHRYLFKHHDIWGHSFRTNLTARMISMDAHNRSFFIKTDSDGFRNDKNLASTLRSSRKRALFVGCSFTAGDGVSNADRFSDKFNESQVDYSAYNAALPGTGNDQHLLITQFFRSQHEFDLVVLSPYTGCAGRNLLSARQTLDPLYGVKVDRAKPFFRIIEGELVLFNSPVPKRRITEGKQVAATIDSMPQRDDFSGSFSYANKLSSKLSQRQRIFSGEDADSHDLLSQILLATINGVLPSRVVLMPLPAKEDIICPGIPSYIHYFAKLATETGASFINVYPAFKKLKSSELKNCFLEQDIHYSPSGHSLIVKCLLDEIGKLGLLS